MSVISFQRKCVFVHIPKCGGTSVRSFLYIYAAGLYSFDPQFADAFPGPYLDDGPNWMRMVEAHPEYFRFTFVRNPYDRFVSYYLHGMRNQRQYKSLFFRNFRECLELSAELLEYEYPHPGISPTAKLGPCQTEFQSLKKYAFPHNRLQKEKLLQYRFHIPGDAGKRSGIAPWSFIGRFENLEQDFGLVREILCLPHAPMIHRNRSEERLVNERPRHYSEYYDPASRRMVEELYADDLEILGYEYERPGAVIVPAPLYDLQKAGRYKQKYSRKERWIFRLRGIYLPILQRIWLAFPDSWAEFLRSNKLYRRCRTALLRAGGQR